jgi:predicted nucleotidyltransferase
MPPRINIFPHEYGLLYGFDKVPEFNNWEKKIEDTIDISIYGIVRYAQLLADGNPNMVESVFTNRESVIYSTPIGEMFRSNRILFLSKQSFYKTREYAFGQLKRLNRVPQGKRTVLYEKYGFDTKAAGHCLRLVDNCEQIITSQHIDLHRNKEMVKSIRRGEWTLEQIREYFQMKELTLEKLVVESKLQEKTDKDKIRELLLRCIEQHYGSLSKSFSTVSRERQTLEQIKQILNGI